MTQSHEGVFDLRDGNFTHFDTFIEQDDGSSLPRLTRLPEELVFDEMPARPAEAFSALMGNETTAPPRFVETVTLPEDAVRDLGT